MTARRVFAAVLLSLATTGGAAAHEAKTSAPEIVPKSLTAIFGGPFALTDHTGQRRTDSDFSGRYLLIYFGFTHCTDVCPLDLDVMSNALSRMGSEGDAIQPLFITVDPGRDTPGVMAAFVKRHHPRLIGLTGSEADIRGASKAYRVHRRKVVPQDAEPGDYLATHSSLTYLMDREGRFLTLFPHGTGPDAMAETLKSYLGMETAPHAGTKG